jgi:hypothetical protein
MDAQVKNCLNALLPYCLIDRWMLDVRCWMFDVHFSHSSGTRSAVAGGTRSVASASLHHHLSSSLCSLRSLWLNKEAVNHRHSLLTQEAFA